MDAVATRGEGVQTVPDVLERTQAITPPPPSTPLVPRSAPDERPARSQLLEQVARLETELQALFCSAYPRQGFDFHVRSRGGGARMLSLGELECLRDDLAERLHDTRRTLSDRTYDEEKFRVEIERMMLEPEKHKWKRIANEDIGERGCKHWHVRPRWGFIGVLAGWWRVVISSGCPLAAPREGAISIKLPGWGSAAANGWPSGSRRRMAPGPRRPARNATRRAAGG